jgi:hypothetical protein
MSGGACIHFACVRIIAAPLFRYTGVAPFAAKAANGAEPTYGTGAENT